MAPIRVKDAEDATDYVEQLIKKHKVMVFSKTYCPYCTQVKKLLKELHEGTFVLELDDLSTEEANLIQAALKKKTKQGTVPNIFINGKHIGGCDDTVKLHQQKKLLPLLNTSA